MKPNALKILAALEGPASLAELARIAGVPLPNASIAVKELAASGFVRKSREGKSVVVDPLPFPSQMALRDELKRHPRLRLAPVARGRRAAIVAGLGFAAPAFLRRATGFSASAMGAIVARLDRFGLLQNDTKLRLTIADEHAGLRTFCQEVCDRELALELRRVAPPGTRVLWSRSAEALVAWAGGGKLPRPYKPAAYEAAARKGIGFHAGETYAIRSLRTQTWADTVLQTLLVPPGGPLNRSHAAIMAAHHRIEKLPQLARWYGLEESGARLRAFLRGAPEDPMFLPRADIEDLAAEAGVAF